MKYVYKFDHFHRELVTFAKENWFEVAVLCLWISIVFWIIIALFSWW